MKRYTIDEISQMEWDCIPCGEDAEQVYWVVCGILTIVPAEVADVIIKESALILLAPDLGAIAIARPSQTAMGPWRNLMILTDVSADDDDLTQVLLKEIAHVWKKHHIANLEGSLSEEELQRHEEEAHALVDEWLAASEQK